MSNPGTPTAPRRRLLPPRGNDLQSRIRRVIIHIMERQEVSMRTLAARADIGENALRHKLYGPTKLSFEDAELLLLVLGHEVSSFGTTPIPGLPGNLNIGPTRNIKEKS